MRTNTFDCVVNPSEGRDVFEELDARHGPDGLLHGEGFDLSDEVGQPPVLVVIATAAHQTPDHIQARKVEEVLHGNTTAILDGVAKKKKI